MVRATGVHKDAYRMPILIRRSRKGNVWCHSYRPEIDMSVLFWLLAKLGRHKEDEARRYF
ncbi:hypothetical protein CsSME_00048229 [Camellia sinensis var. sinensis]